MELTKTQKALIEEASNNSHKVVCVVSGYKSRRSFGDRRRQAALALVEAGLFKLIHSESGKDGCVTYRATSFELV